MSPQDVTKAADAIRLIFTDRRRYTVTEVADCMELPVEILLHEIEARDLDLVSEDPRLPWSEVAYLALRTWPLHQIFEALGVEAGSYIPDLLRPTSITVTLPAYQVRMLEVLSREQQLDVSTFLQLHLLDLASAESPFLDEQIPGFFEAFHFPFGGQR